MSRQRGKHTEKDAKKQFTTKNGAMGCRMGVLCSARVLSWSIPRQRHLRGRQAFQKQRRLSSWQPLPRLNAFCIPENDEGREINRTGGRHLTSINGSLFASIADHAAANSPRFPPRFCLHHSMAYKFRAEPEFALGHIVKFGSASFRFFFDLVTSVALSLAWYSCCCNAKLLVMPGACPGVLVGIGHLACSAWMVRISCCIGSGRVDVKEVEVVPART